jgi:hypothetical protein
MGTTLTGTQIQNTYDGLIKTTDNTAITATTKLISDGLGNDTCIKVGTAGTDFLGNVDFSAATVTGLPGGAAGLVSGTGTDSMKNADSLVTTPAVAAAACSIALGDTALVNPNGIGGIAIGYDACIQGVSSIRTGQISIGCNSRVAYDGIAIGGDAAVLGTKFSLAIGCGAQDGSGTCNISIGYLAGVGAPAVQPNAIMIGTSAKATICAVALGANSFANANSAVALGYGVTASTADTVSVRALETQTASTPTAGGIIMTDAGSTARRLNIDASGNLQIDSTPVGGGGGAAGLVNGAGTDSLKNADSLVTTPASAAGACSIALGNGASNTGDHSYSIGTSACAANGSIAIGRISTVTGSNVVAIGCNARSSFGFGAVSIGQNSVADNLGFTSSVAVGRNTTADADGIAIGCGSRAQCAGSAAIGKGVTSSRVDTVTGKQLEACVAGKGIVVTSPDGLTTLGIGIDNTGAIVTYTP